MMKRINKILVANRGEIALRVMKSIRKMGIQSVAIYSEADKDAPHVLYADQSVCIGPAPSAQSYLKGDVIIRVAKELGADAIHPGYGFLSENASFAKKVQDSGLIFIGPNPYSIEVMGDKLASKATVKKYNIPMVPGTDHAIKDVAEAIEITKSIGFPILIKASAGGGGKGMRVVQKAEDIEEQMKRAINEATAAFGDGSVFIEKYVSSPRHIEMQILADNEGNTVYLFERECSIQRRNQKVVEEAPSTVLNDTLRKEMGTAAVNVAKACGYTGAGTVEFLVDDNHKFYFLEMNTRLQVEHPVTEFITGLDLVEEQIKIARGESLSFKQEDLNIKGHAFELRVLAEDVWNNFNPDIGNITRYETPKGKNVRVDDGIRQGSEVSVYYDSLLAKLIAYGSNRTEAIQNMLKAIDEYTIEGVETTLPFGHFVFTHPNFVSGNFNTAFIPTFFTKEISEELHKKEARTAARLALHQYLEDAKKLRLPII
ncbi:MAG: acetyl-CoA carboxylase biotin carboxylase subunit [Ginsengibacter sp.]